jgi:peptidase E
VSEHNIVAMGGGGFSEDGSEVDRFVLDLAGASRPRICFVPTASGDADAYVVRFYRSFPSADFRPSDLSLFERRVADVESFLLEQDVIYVGGGNTANLLDVWRRHGVDVAVRAAWERGVVLAGVSAGANCWFEASTTDSFGPELQPLRDGLGLLPGSFSPHYDGELGRRPLLHRLIADGFPAGFAADDGAACHFAGTELAGVIRSAPGANVYRIERAPDGSVSETPIA